MTETIDSANAAASSLFLGHNGEWWDFWLIVSVGIAALVAAAVGVTTTGSIVSHKREAAAAEAALEWYKLETEKKISEANAAGETAKADAERARAEAAKATERAAKIEQAAAWRVISNDDAVKLINVLKTAGGSVEIGYPANDPEALFLASQIAKAFDIVNNGQNPPLWNVHIQPRQFSHALYWGVRIFGQDPATISTLETALSLAHVPYTNESMPNTINDSPGMTITGGPPGPATIFVGSKRPPN
jgi:hypothetical protein